MTLLIARAAACGALFLASLGGCGLQRSPASALPAAATERDAPSDADLAATLVAANDVEVLSSELALAASRDADVLAFATMTKTDHQAIDVRVRSFLTRLGVSPADDVAASALRADADGRRRALRTFEGFAFDSAWSATEVRSHRALLALFDDTLIPRARGIELRELLQRVRPAVVAHLGHAVSLSDKVASRRP